MSCQFISPSNTIDLHGTWVLCQKIGNLSPKFKNLTLQINQLTRSWDPNHQNIW